MTPSNDGNAGKPGGDRRRSERFDTRLAVDVRSPKEAPSVEAWVIEIGANGMKLITPRALTEASSIHIGFRGASNNTHCEGVVVWTRPVKDATDSFESGVDIKKWGGDMPSEEFIRNAPNLRLKPDRRRPR
jgi:hypothetical protein